MEYSKYSKYSKILEKVENIDVYIRSIIENSEEDDDNHPFIDKEDCYIYLSISEREILKYTMNILSSFIKNIDEKNLKNSDKIAIGIACYILSIKYYLDCCLNFPYTYIWNIIGYIEDDIDIDIDIKNEEEIKKLIKYTIDIEKLILKKTNFLTQIV